MLILQLFDLVIVVVTLLLVLLVDEVDLEGVLFFELDDLLLGCDKG